MPDRVVLGSQSSHVQVIGTQKYKIM